MGSEMCIRDRVGRGSAKSYCILVERNVTPISRSRLTIMENTNDGFIIADEDLKLRGPGKFFSTEQSGFFRYKIADMVNDGPIIRRARKAAKKIVKMDPLLEKHFLMIRRPPRSTQGVSSAASDVYKRQVSRLREIGVTFLSTKMQ